jgi:hypothetical protein
MKFKRCVCNNSIYIRHRNSGEAQKNEDQNNYGEPQALEWLEYPSGMV